jgi:hypothetical protein
LVEKAWAKIHGSYNNIVRGCMHETMRDLTGAPSNSYSISQFPAIFISIQYAELMGYIVTVSAGENKNLAEIGFDPNYYYSIIEVGNSQDADGNNK